MPVGTSYYSSTQAWMKCKKKLFGTLKFGKIDVLINFNFFPQFSQFFLWEVNLRGLRAFILQNVQGSVVETEKKVLLPITQLGKEETLIILLSAWDRSRDSKAKRNLSKHMWRSQLKTTNSLTIWVCESILQKEWDSENDQKTKLVSSPTFYQESVNVLISFIILLCLSIAAKNYITWQIITYKNYKTS